MAVLADDLANRGYLGRRAGQKHFLGFGELLRHDRPLNHLDAALPCQTDHRLSGYAVEKAIRAGCVKLAIDDEKDVGSRPFGELAPPVEHQRVIASVGL